MPLSEGGPALGRVAVVLAGALVALALAPGSAHASARRVDALLPAARSAWPGSPCEGREIVLTSRASPDGEATVDQAGWAQPRACRVWIRSNLPVAELCLLLTHELGHLAGYDHDATLNDGVMMPMWWIARPPACAPLFVRQDRIRGIPLYPPVPVEPLARRGRSGARGARDAGRR